jgi:O-antigen/teichoic acid export membrane protein
LKLSTNIIANLIGRIWIAGIGIILVPQYIKFLGIESYGLVGFYSTLIATMGLLDLGLSITLNRELTKATVENQSPEKIRNLVFTIECIYWLIGIVMATGIVFLAPVIATHWVKAEKLPLDTVKQAIIVMGVVVAFQWPISLYNGGLTGLERQVADNIIAVIMTTLRSAGVILLLWLVSPTIQMFFIWQAIISFVYVVVMRVALWHYLPKSKLWPSFSRQQLKQIWRFAAGMTGISIVSFILMQADKIVLSKILPLSEFAYYMLAFTVCSGIGMFVAPINIAFFPRFTALVVAKNRSELALTYHKACRLVATVTFPVGLVLVVFAKDILLIWTKDTTTVSHTTLMVQILVTGSVFNSLMVMPYILLLANGRTRFTFYQNVISCVILVPLLFWWVHVYGAVGGTLVWLTVNAGCIIFSMPLIHAKLLPGELKTWYFKDTLLPLLPPLVCIVVIKLLVGKLLIGVTIGLISIIIISLLTFCSSMFFLPECRLWIRHKIAYFKANV